MIDWRWLLISAGAAFLFGWIVAASQAMAETDGSVLAEWWRSPGRVRRAVKLAAVCIVWLVVVGTGTVLVSIVVGAVAGGLTASALSELGPVATGLTALVALLIGAGTIWQKMANDRREQWWKRTEWALGWTYSPAEPADDRANVGSRALAYQLGSGLAGLEEKRFLRRAMDDVVDVYEAEMRTLEDAGQRVVFELDDDGEG